MNFDKGKREKETRGSLTVHLPVEIIERLEQFCRDRGVAADTAVERALRDYFREGDMSH
jgi:hypothetical protein